MDCYLTDADVREQYAPQTLGSGSSRRRDTFSRLVRSHGTRISYRGMVYAVRQAADFLEPEAPRAAKRFKWASYLGRFGYPATGGAIPREINIGTDRTVRSFSLRSSRR